MVLGPVAYRAGTSVPAVVVLRGVLVGLIGVVVVVAPGTVVVLRGVLVGLIGVVVVVTCCSQSQVRVALRCVVPLPNRMRCSVARPFVVAHTVSKNV